MTYIHCDYQVLKDAEAHLQLATQERSYYRSMVDASKEVLRETLSMANFKLLLSSHTRHL